MQPCKYCNEFAVEKVESGELVCTSCGLVNDDFVVDAESAKGNFVSFNNNNKNCTFENQSTSHGVRRTHSSTRSATVSSSRALIKSLASKIGLGSEKCTTIEYQFMKLYPKYKAKRKQFKHIMAGCCVYSAAQASGLSIMVSDLCQLLSCPVGKFHVIYRQLKKEINLSDKSISRPDLVSSILSGMPYETEAQKEERRQLIKQTLTIMEFVDKCWIMTGRSVESTSIACSYIAWKNMDKKRLNMPFEYFFREMGFKKIYSTAFTRSCEIHAALVKLARHIPYVDKTSITFRTVIIYVNTILSSCESLFDALCESEDDDLDEEMRLFIQLRRRAKSIVKDDGIVEIEETLPVDDDDLIPECDWGIYLRSEEEVNILERLQEEDDDVDSLDLSES